LGLIPAVGDGLNPSSNSYPKFHLLLILSLNCGIVPLVSVGFRGPKSKNRHSGTVLDDTDVSGRRSETSKDGRKMARACRAMWHGRATMARGDRATWHGHAALPVRVRLLGG